MSRKPITNAIWKTMVRRYIAISIIGAVIGLYFFYRLYVIPASQPVPLWVVIGASIGGLMTASGLFGIAVSFFFQMLGQEGRGAHQRSNSGDSA